MSDMALLWFYDRTTEERIGRDVESPFVPRVGETVGVDRKTWLVENVDYLWPVPGSPSYRDGNRRPIVRVFVVKSEGPFGRAGKERR